MFKYLSSFSINFLLFVFREMCPPAEKGRQLGAGMYARAVGRPEGSDAGTPGLSKDASIDVYVRRATALLVLVRTVGTENFVLRGGVCYTEIAELSRACVKLLTPKAHCRSPCTPSMF